MLDVVEAAGRWEANSDGTRVLYGVGRLDELGETARSLGVSRALVVTDPGVRRAGHADRGVASLESASLAVEVFDGVHENPTTAHVAAGVEIARNHGAELLVGIGGGSAMDATKGINFLLTGGGKMEDYWGVGKATQPMLPSIGVPTTAGTGSEAQSFALISQLDTRAKMACGDKKAKFKAAILDPELTVSLTPQLTAVIGMDAVSHAVESFVSRPRNPISTALSKQAFAFLNGAYEQVLDHPGDVAARGRMMIGAHLAGAAIEASMLGAAHACSNPLSARYGVVHGSAVALTLPHVIRYNGGEVDGLYEELIDGGAEALAARIEHLRERGGLPSRLSACGVPREALRELAEEAATQWTAGFNPRAVTAAELLGLYEAAY